MNLFGQAADLDQPLAGEDKTWAIVASICPVVCCGFVGPLVIYFIKKDKAPGVGKIALHTAAFAGAILVLLIAFQVLMMIFGAVVGAIAGDAAGAIVGCLGLVVYLGLFVFYLVMLVMATIAVSKGDKYFQFPITSGFIK